MVLFQRTATKLFVLLFVCCFWAQAQQPLSNMNIDQVYALIDDLTNTKRDSAIALLEYALPRTQQLKDPEEHAKFMARNMLQRAGFFSHYGLDSANTCWQHALAYYKDHPNMKLLAEAYGVRAQMEMTQKGHTPGVLHYLDTAESYTVQQDDAFISAGLFYMHGYVLQMMERWQQSYEKTNRAAHYAELSNDSLTASAVHFLLARIHQYYGMHCKAQDEIISALAYGAGHWPTASLYETLGDVHSKKEEVTLAAQSYAAAIAELKKSTHTNYDHILKLYAKIGHGLLDANRSAEATEILKSMNALVADSLQHPVNKGYHTYYKVFKARILSLQGAHQAAHALIAGNRFLGEKKGFVVRKEFVEYYKYLAEIEANAGYSQKAFALLLKSGNLKDSINGYTNKKQLDDIETLYLTEKEKNTEIQLANAKLSKGKRNQALLGGGLLGLLLLSGSVVYLIRNRNFKQRERLKSELKEQQLGQMLNAQEEERKRIARELHDGIGQSLAALKMQLQLATKNQFSNQAISRVDALCKEVRGLSHQMMPIILQQNGIKDALEELIRLSLSKNGIETDLLIHGFDQRISTQIEVHLYRISQELIANILKHSQATKVGIQLLQRSERVSLVVEDNGKGMPKLKQKKKGLGMLSIASRMEAIGGKWSIDSKPGKGTLISISIPILTTERLTA